MIILADHRNGTWLGSSQALSALTDWSVRQCQALLRSLRIKGYIEGECKRGIGNYRIRIIKYFKKEAHPHAQLPVRSAPPCATTPQEAHPHATFQEERLQEENHKINTAQTQREHSPALIRGIEAKAQREKFKREDRLMEIPIGESKVKEGYQEFVDLRSAGRLPQGMTWGQWQKLSPEDRASVLAGNVVAIRKAL
jgi:hypothetical protein